MRELNPPLVAIQQEDRKEKPESPPILERQTTWEAWERGRAARRTMCDQITGGRELRRASGDPRKDVILRRLNNGERGMPFVESSKLEIPSPKQTRKK